jgi:hypothetical protein
MSFGRLVYYSAVLAGWAAFAAWLIAETVILARLPAIEVLLTAGIVGAAIGCAVNIAAGLNNPSVPAIFSRALPGLAGGAIGGALGGLVGDLAYGMGLPRGLGWMLMGIGIGILEGVQEQSLSKIRNGLIGGAAGGLLGGVLFDPIQKLAASGSGMSSRAIAFVVLGLAIGACIGLAQVVLKEAWLTVIDGYRPGRQLILSRPVTTLGRAEHLPLPFMGPMNREVAIEHARILRQGDGGFVLEDLGVGPGIALNRKPLASATRLFDGDVIKLGPNVIRFNERHARPGNHGFEQAGHVASQTKQQPPPAPSPPPPPPAPLRAANPGAPRPVMSQPQLSTRPTPGSRTPPPPPPPAPPPPKR